MADQPSRSKISNRILSRLSREDFGLLEPHLEPLDLPVRKTLETRKRPIDHVYFIESGFASVVANGSGNPGIEVGIIGREGMTGFSVILGNKRAADDVYMQAAGHGWRMGVADLHEADEKSLSLHRAFLRYANSFMQQTTKTALANGRSKVEERLARWLLMADDRIDGGELVLTHEFLSIMLGVPRPGVTLAVQALAQQRLISTKRGRITIINRKALEKNTDGTYNPDV
jgi:CRP-like cAMP-binding protein